MYICLKKKRNVLLNKKAIFVFHMIFKLDFMTQSFTVLSRDVCTPFSYFCYSFISVSKKQNIETMPTLSYSFLSYSLCSNAYDDVTDFEICRFWKNTKI